MKKDCSDVLHVNSHGRSSAGQPIKCQGTPCRRGVPTGSIILQHVSLIVECHFAISCFEYAQPDISIESST